MSLDVSLFENEVCVYDSNITHNLNRMANEAGIYKALWCPADIEAVKAKNLIPILRSGLEELKANPNKYKAFNASNGWGKYENLVSFTEDYLQACKQYPESVIEIWK